MKLRSLASRIAHAGGSRKPGFACDIRRKEGRFPLPAAEYRSLSGTKAAIVLLMLCSLAMAQGDSLQENSGTGAGDSLLRKISLSQGDSLQPQDSAPQKDSLSKRKAAGLAAGQQVNLVETVKNIRAFGWGEYRVGGRCLCCDNMLDGDCIIVHNTNRTERVRIKQIVDGKTEADTGDKKTYFGDVEERDRPEPVKLLMAEIDIGKLQNIHRVTIYTMLDKEKKKSYLSNCELGYYDQFDRLQWVGKLENKSGDDHLTFEMEKPILTKCILLKVSGGKSRITEVGIFAGRTKQ